MGGTLTLQGLEKDRDINQGERWPWKGVEGRLSITA
jgi:hypothetical protein